MTLLVALTWSAIANKWSFLVRALKCSVSLSLKKKSGQIAAKKKRNKFGSNIMFIQNCEISLCLSPLLVFFFVVRDWRNGAAWLKLQSTPSKISKCNRTFYRFGGHIELVRIKEHYGMHRGHEHIPVYLSALTHAFRDIFS